MKTNKLFLGSLAGSLSSFAIPLLEARHGVCYAHLSE